MNGRFTKKSSGRLATFLEKWSTASVLVLVVFSTIGVLIVTPRPTQPHVLPMPAVDLRQLRRVEQQETARAFRAKQDGLPQELRIVGEQIRRVGLHLARDNAAPNEMLSQLQADTQELLSAARDTQLLELRALQAELFLQAARRWEGAGQPDQDLLELGGQFVSVATQSWRDSEGYLLHSDDELRLFFRIHWGRLSGVHGHPSFGPSLPELRRYYATNLRLPHASGNDEASRAETRLELVRALGAVDPDYPAQLAEGMLSLQVHRPAHALRALSAFISQNKSGRWMRIARNHLRLAERDARLLAEAAP